MAKIEPIKGYFENPRALLARIAENEDIGSMVIYTFSKDGRSLKHGQLNMTDQQLALVAVLSAKRAADSADD